MSAAIVDNGRIAWWRGFGYADGNAELPASDTTGYHLASLTKTFAAIILMQLVEAGEVSLDDPIGEYRIDLPNSENITIRHLMKATVGASSRRQGVPRASR